MVRPSGTKIAKVIQINRDYFCFLNQKHQTRKESDRVSYWKIFLELHKDKEFRKQMILPYISLIVSIIALTMTFLPRSV